MSSDTAHEITLEDGLGARNMELVLAWSNARSQAFLLQWCGPRLSYPLTVGQLESLASSMVSIFMDGEFVGVIQRMDRQDDNQHIGRFLINPQYAGAGLGRTALQLMCEKVFSDRTVFSITLNVYVDNLPAIRCYEKCGFEQVLCIDGDHPMYRMRLLRKPIHTVAVSACLMGVNCKYNGANNRDERLQKYLEGKTIIEVCPEVAGGLPIPRTPAELINGRMTDWHGNDMQEQMMEGIHHVLDILEKQAVDLVILQPRSPSCAVHHIYDGTFSGRLVPGSGLLATALREAGYRVVEPDDLFPSNCT